MAVKKKRYEEETPAETTPAGPAPDPAAPAKMG
jgi:hypothetical protein